MKIQALKQQGFTLIEVIVTLVIVALAGVVIFAYMGSALTRSHEPLAMVGDLGQAVTVMEEVTANYQDYRLGGMPWGDPDNPSGTNNFSGWLAAEGISTAKTTATVGGFSFDMLEVTIGVNDQTVSAFFTQ